MRDLLTPLANDGPGFHTNMPVSELIERDTQEVEASIVSSAPLVVKTEDGVTRKTRLTPIKSQGLGGLSRLILDQETKVRRLAREGLEAASRQTELGEKNRDEPQWPCPTPLRSGQGHPDLSRSILTSNQTHRISVEERPTGHPSLSNDSSIYREAGYEVVECHMRALPTPSVNDGPRFHTNMPVSELIEHNT